MRYRLILLVGLSLLGLAGCKSLCGGHGGGNQCGANPCGQQGQQSWWDKLTKRSNSAPAGGPMMMEGGYGFGAPMDGGCSSCGSSPGLPEGEPILTAPQKVGSDGKAAPGYAEPMPFTPKK